MLESCALLVGKKKFVLFTFIFIFILFIFIYLYSKRCLHTYVHKSIIHNSLEVQATQMFFDRWIDKKTVGLHE